MRLSYLGRLLILIIPLLFFFHTRGAVTHDEGYILSSAEKIAQGLLPYRDFHFVYAPLSVFLTALSFSILQTSIFASRILMIAISLLSCFLLFKIITLATRNKLYATLSVLIFVAWGPTHINFSWPVMYAIPTSLFTSLMLLKFLDTRRERYLFFAGVAAFSVFLAKQNFGIVMIFPLLALFAVKNMRRIKYLLSFAYGYAWGIILFCTYLLATGSFAGFVSDFYFFTVRWIIINASLTTPFIYTDDIPKMILRTLLYLLPLIFSFCAIILLFIRRRFHLIFLAILTLVFYVVGIRPTTDYVHLVPLLSMSGIPIMLYLRYNISKGLRFLLFAGIFAFIIFGFYTALFKGYYKWDTPIATHNNFSNNSKIKIFLNDKFFNEFNDIIYVTSSKTKPNDFIYVDSFNSLLYFITNRRDATNYGFLGVGVDPKQYYDHVVGNLVAKDVKLVFLNHQALPNHPIKNFIEKHYKFYKTIQDFDVYERISH